METKIIFVVDDDAHVRDLVHMYLANEGYEVRTFTDAGEVLVVLGQGYPDMLIIDIMMPGMDGYELCKRIRQESQVPIIIVSAKDEELDKVLGLELGSDDYVAKPFSPRELVARVKTIFRRVGREHESSNQDATVLSVGNLSVWEEDRRVIVKGRQLALTIKEYELLILLLKNKNKAFKREELLDRIWGYDYYGDRRAVDDLVKRVRRKLKEDNADIEIKTVWGYGYKVEG